MLPYPGLGNNGGDEERQGKVTQPRIVTIGESTDQERLFAGIDACGSRNWVQS